jgi:hypothetical protein
LNLLREYQWWRDGGGPNRREIEGLAYHNRCGGLQLVKKYAWGESLHQLVVAKVAAARMGESSKIIR